jgi:hypothetical protein
MPIPIPYLFDIRAMPIPYSRYAAHATHGAIQCHFMPRNADAPYAAASAVRAMPAPQTPFRAMAMPDTIKRQSMPTQCRRPLCYASAVRAMAMPPTPFNDIQCHSTPSIIARRRPNAAIGIPNRPKRPAVRAHR